MPSQLRLDLDDRQLYLKALMDREQLGSYSDWYVFRLGSGKFWLGIRTHDLGGTDYTYVEKVTYDEARWLVSLPHVYEFMECVKTHQPGPSDRPFEGLDLATLEHCLKICDHALEHYKGAVTMKVRREIAETIKRVRQS